MKFSFNLNFEIEGETLGFIVVILEIATLVLG